MVRITALFKSIENREALREGKYLDVSKWFNAAANRATELASDIGGKKAPELIEAAGFDIGIVDEEVYNLISLGQKKFIFTSSSFINNDLVFENLGISEMFNNSLFELNQNHQLIYTDNTALKPYKITGKYSIIDENINIVIVLTKENELIKKNIFKGELQKLNILIDESISFVLQELK